MMRCLKNIIVISALAAALPLCGPLSLRAQEGGQGREIRSLISGILGAASDERRQELIGQLRAYPAAAVAGEWLAELDRTRRTASLVRVIDAMAEFPDRRYVIPLANHLIDSHHPVRRSAARALKKSGDDRLYPVILKMAGSDVPVHRIYFIEAMNYLYDQRFYQALALLMREDNKSIRIYVLNCFKENRINESLGLIRGAALQDRNEEVRIAAIEALGTFRDGGSLGVLHAALNDRSREIRCEAARSLGRIGSAMSVMPLSSRLAVEEDAEIKERIIGSLAVLRRVGDTRGLERILLSDRSASLRVRAAYLLGFSGSAQSFAALSRGTGDADYRVRAEACASLGSFRNRQALGALFAVMDRDEPVYVKSAALYAVKRINDRSSLLGLFDLYTRERDPVFREILREAVREYIRRYT